MHLAIFLTMVMFQPEGVAHAKPPTPLALMEGVRQSRNNLDEIRATVVRRVNRPRVSLSKGVMEWSNGMQRLDREAGSGLDHTTVKGSDTYIEYDRKKSSSVILFSEEMAGRERSCSLFDVRILGLATKLFCDNSLDVYLWTDGVLAVEPTPVQINGVGTWHVTARRENGVSREYWIEEPGFRVHKAAITGKYLVESRFDRDDFVLPTSVVVTGISEDCQIEYELSDVELNLAISPERFELIGMDIPLNTPVSDYRIKRRVGYWTGNDLSESPVRSPQQFARTTVEQPDLPAAEGWGVWPFLLVAIVGLGLAALLRKRQLG